MSYSSPLNGVSRVLTSDLVIYSCPFLRAGRVYFGARTSFITVDRTEKEMSLLIYAPVPWGTECQQVLNEISEREKRAVNVKYIVAPDVEHYMGVVGWKTQFSDASIITVEGVAEKLTKNATESIEIDYEFVADKPYPEFPQELTRIFQWQYVPGHHNKEIALLHKPSKTLIVADLLFNGPAYEQYEESGINPTSGVFSKVMKYMYPDSCLQLMALPKIMPIAKSHKDIKAIMGWDFDRAIPCHGDVIETSAKEKLSKLFDAYLK
ncbi:hypothetical protein NADFUDRAFT_8497, partial [Nadsonia fulvescens var. elongata DSM 6958]